jgi:DNA-binding beta-propeller fold protein YncE
MAKSASTILKLLLAFLVGAMLLVGAYPEWHGSGRAEAVSPLLDPTTSGYGDAAAVTWYVTTHSGNDLIQYDGNGQYVKLLVGHGSGGLDEPRGFLFVGSYLYIASANKETSSVLRYNAQTGTFIDVFATGSTLQHPYSLAFSPVNGNLLAVNQDNNAIAQFDGQTGKPLGYFVPDGSGGLSAPRAAVFGPDKNLYVASRDTDSVLRFNGTTGDPMGAFVAAGSADLKKPIQIVFGPDGNLYVGSSGNNKVLRYDGSTGAPLPGNPFVDGSKPSGGGLNAPSGMAFSPADGDLYVASRLTSQILKYDGKTGAFIKVFIAQGVGDLDTPEYIQAVGP